MSDLKLGMQWNDETLRKFKDIIERIPLFHRDIAKEVVHKKAELNAKERNSEEVEEGDVVRAFFTEVPMTFYSLMIRLLQNTGFDYKKYEEK